MQQSPPAWSAHTTELRVRTGENETFPAIDVIVLRV